MVGRWQVATDDRATVSYFVLPAVVLKGDYVEFGASPLAVPDALNAAIDCVGWVPPGTPTGALVMPAEKAPVGD